MSTPTAKPPLVAPKKRRLKLSTEEAAGVARLKGTSKAATDSGRAKVAEFTKFRNTNPGW